jgi:FtsH-binding integral membrane protein
MQSYRGQLSVEDRLFGQTMLEREQVSVIKKTYMLLGLSVVAAIAGGQIGSTTPAILSFFSSWIGWIVAMVALNAIPMIAMACRHNPVLGIGALLLDGFFAGIVLAPLLYMANRIAPDIVFTAMAITGIVFLSVTGYVMTAKRSFSAPKGLMTGMFFAIIGIVVLNIFMSLSWLSLLLSGLIGIFGLFTLIYATSDVINNPEADSPIPGALMLFSGLFMIFQAVLRILLAFASDD